MLQCDVGDNQELFFYTLGIFIMNVCLGGVKSHTASKETLRSQDPAGI